MFGRIETTAGMGAMLAHRLITSQRTFQKGHLLSAHDVRLLLGEGVHQIVVHRLEPSEVDETTAAEIVSRPFVSEDIEARAAIGGRINLYSTSSGLLRANQPLIDDFNAIDDAITFACLNDYSQVAAGDLVGTIKIIPLAVLRQSAAEAVRSASSAAPLLVKPFISHTATIVSTVSEGVSPKSLAKTVRVTSDRLLVRDSEVISEIVVDHSVVPLANALLSESTIRRHRPHMIIVFGASAVSDAHDVIPSAIRAAGGQVERVGMPVDPGNLAVVGRVDGTIIIGAPGCARSPAMNGLDFILDRVIAGEEVSRAVIARMGVGGLLKDIEGRTQRREDIVGHATVSDLRKIA